MGYEVITAQHSTAGLARRSAAHQNTLHLALSRCQSARSWKPEAESREPETCAGYQGQMACGSGGGGGQEFRNSEDAVVDERRPGAAGAEGRRDSTAAHRPLRKRPCVSGYLSIWVPRYQSIWVSW